jgi:hypothetical protein
MLEAINNSETYKTNEEQMLLDKKSKDLSDLSEFIHGSMLTTEEILD